jgi:hypothetical protein
MAPGGFHQVLGIPLTFELNLCCGLFNLGQVDGCQLHVRRREWHEDKDVLEWFFVPK